MIPDRVFYPLAALIVAALVCLALAWPQGQGAPSWGPFRKPAALPPGPLAVPARPAAPPPAAGAHAR